jgi:hypothetical protein
MLRVSHHVVIALCLPLTLACFVSYAQDAKPVEYTATATSTQEDTRGQMYNVTIIIDSFSPTTQTQELVNTFENGGNKALVATLLKYPSRGHISVTGSGNNIGYTIVYARKIAMPDGTTKIRLITNTPMNMANSFNTQNVENTFSGAILDISPNKGKSSGQLIEAAELQYDKQKKLELGLEGARPWTLANISEREK